MKLKMLLGVCFICLLPTACRELPSEEKNPLDPGSENYSPESPILSGGQIDKHMNLLIWTNRSSNVVGFRLERQLNNRSGFQTIKDCPLQPGGYAYYDTSSFLVSGLSVVYRVYAYVSLKVESPSNEITIIMK